MGRNSEEDAGDKRMQVIKFRPRRIVKKLASSKLRLISEIVVLPGRNAEDIRAARIQTLLSELSLLTVVNYLEDGNRSL